MVLPNQEKDIRDTIRAVSGIATAYGPTDPRTQKIVLAHCQRGGAEVMREVIAEVMLDLAINERRVPAPIGIKTKELLERVQQALIEICKEYLHEGGVLVARRFIKLEELHATLLKFWHARFAKPIKNTPSVIDGLPQQELLARLSIAAHGARDIVKTQLKTISVNGQECYYIPENFLEPFCMAIANAAYQGFHRPDHMVDRLARKQEKKDVR